MIVYDTRDNLALEWHGALNESIAALAGYNLSSVIDDRIYLERKPYRD